MINIASFKVLKGYEHWKTVFMDEEFVKRREQAGVEVLAKGFDAQNDRVYAVQELDSLEVIQNAMAKNAKPVLIYILLSIDEYICGKCFKIIIWIFYNYFFKLTLKI